MPDATALSSGDGTKRTNEAFSNALTGDIYHGNNSRLVYSSDRGRITEKKKGTVQLSGEDGTATCVERKKDEAEKPLRPSPV